MVRRKVNSAIQSRGLVFEMSKKGTSYEEKRTRLLNLLQEADTFFIYKEIEALVSKRRLFPTQAIKDILQSLLDDGLAHSEKVGSQNIFWCLKSEQKAARLRLEAEIVTIKTEIENIKQKLSISDHPDHQLLAKELTAQLNKNKELLSQNSSQIKMSPSEYNIELKLCEEGIDRWIDNMEIVNKALELK